MYVELKVLPVLEKLSTFESKIGAKENNKCPRRIVSDTTAGAKRGKIRYPFRFDQCFRYCRLGTF
jgi:hypothetical protein